MSGVRYRATGGSFEAPEGHAQLDGDEYLAPDGSKVDVLEEMGKIEVIEWDHGGEETPVSLDGPAEPVVVDSDGPGASLTDVECIKPGEDTPGIQRVELGTWECQRCGRTTTVPPADGKLEEPHECSGCDRQGPFVHAGGIGTEGTAAARAAVDTWRAPTGISDEDFAGIWRDVRQFIQQYWDSTDPELYEGLTAYAITTWLREELTFVPHLMLMGKTTGGKTRLLNTLARVSYRALVVASATPASMFRLIDGYSTTYYVSEYHGLEYDTRRELDAVVRAGQKRGEKVTRAESVGEGHKPESFDPFSHVAIATQFEPDDDIVNRCIQVRSASADRDVPATFNEDEAAALRNRLLYARFRLLESEEWQQAEDEAYRIMAERDIRGRTREKLLSLISAAVVWDKVEELEPFIEELERQDRQAAADSEDALVIEALRDLAFEAIGDTQVIGDADPFAAVEIPLDKLRERYEEMTGEEKSPQWFGHARKRLGLNKERYRDGTVITDPDLADKLQTHCEDHNLDWEASDRFADVERLPDEEKGKRAGGCGLCGTDAFLTHRELDSGSPICENCADDITND